MNIIELEKYRNARNKPRRFEAAMIRPHRPSDRILVGRITASPALPNFSTWEIRAFDRTGPFHLYFSTREMLHLQLWNPYFGISVLSPSKITGHLYEAFPLFGWKLAAASYAEIEREIVKRFSTTLPSLGDINAFANDYYAVKNTKADGNRVSKSGVN